MDGTRQHRIASFLVVTVATLIALVSARPYAGCWNDGSRLATVEALVDYHSLAVDRSMFLGVPEPTSLAALPYPAEMPSLVRYGTLDKLFIHGHYYSDKSPVPALLLAGFYQVCQWSTGLIARDQADVFCYLMTVCSSGIAYVAAVWCIFALGGIVKLPLRERLLLTISFAFGTVSLPYVRQTNNHIMLLGVTAGITLLLARLQQDGAFGAPTLRRVALLGFLAGFGYTIDLGAGPVLVTCLLTYVAWHCRRLSSVVTFTLAALPWLLLHHGVNYAVGGTIRPANAVAEYFQWPNSPFNGQTMTGTLKHTPTTLVVYALSLLFGKRGFIGHNLPLYCALAGAFVLMRRRVRELPELACGLAWCGGTWLIYALTSNNSSGQCCTVRWFVPFLAPSYYVIAVLLKQAPQYTRAFLVLSAWGALLAGMAWYDGPWLNHMVPGFWVMQVLALASAGWAIWHQQAETAFEQIAPIPTTSRAAGWYTIGQTGRRKPARNQPADFAPLDTKVA